MTLTNADVLDRWADISIFNAPPASKTLSGLAVEYRVLEVDLQYAPSHII
jgi:hypothetical protein